MEKNIKLVEITEDNWLSFASLSVSDEQKKFLAPPTGIIARGYVYRDCNARVWGITDGEQAIGITLVRDQNEEPVCYDLQQFMIDERFQNRGFGTAALQKILSVCEAERRFDCVEVCVNKADLPALHVYEKVGFVDTGYVDDDLPDCLNLMYYFR